MFKLLPILFGILFIFGAEAMPEGGGVTAAQSSRSRTSSSSSSSSSAAGAASSTAPPAVEDNSQDIDDADSEESSANSIAPVAGTSLRSSIRITSPSQLAASATIQHHVLPAEVIPLPLTISTRPGLRTIIAPETITIHQPTVAKIGEIVQKIPTAVSHQSQTIVHKHARVVTPIVAPAVRTITSQVVRAYHTPLVLAAQAPVVRVISN